MSEALVRTDACDKILLHLLWAEMGGHTALAKVEVSRRSKLSLAYTARILEEMVQEGWISEIKTKKNVKVMLSPLGKNIADLTQQLYAAKNHPYLCG